MPRIRNASLKSGIYRSPWKHKENSQQPYINIYTGASIRSIMAKVLKNIVLTRLSPFYQNQLLTIQFSFCSDKSCNDDIYLKQIQEIAYFFNRKLYNCFIDLTAVYGHTNRDFFISSIKKTLPSSESTECIDLLELYRSTESHMLGNDPKTGTFLTSSGVRHG